MAEQLPYIRGDLTSAWIYLQAGLGKIMQTHSNSMIMQDYMGLSEAVHYVCTFPFSDRSSSTTVEPMADLYKNLKNFLKRHLQISVEKANGMSTETLVTFYISEWTRYKRAAKINGHIFNYLNRHWIQRNIDAHMKDIYKTDTLHFMIWNEIFLMPLQDRLVTPLLRMSEEERLCLGIDRQQIGSMVDSVVDLENLLSDIKGFELKHVRSVLDSLRIVESDKTTSITSLPNRDKHIL